MFIRKFSGAKHGWRHRNGSRLLSVMGGLVLLSLVGCGLQENPASMMEKGGVGKAVLHLPKLPLDSGLIDTTADSARFEITIESSDMTPIVQSWYLRNLPQAAVTIENIPAGWSRQFTGRLYDGSGMVTHEGQAFADVYAGQTVTVHLRLSRATGGGAVVCVEIEGYPRPDCAPAPYTCDTVRLGDSSCVPVDSLHQWALQYCANIGGTMGDFWFSEWCDGRTATYILFSVCSDSIIPPPPPPPPSGGITVLSPNGGESYSIGDSMLIQWFQDSGVGPIDIQIGLGDSSRVVTIASKLVNQVSRSGGFGQFLWTIPDSLGGDSPISPVCWIRIQDSNREWISDMSDSWFSIQSGLGGECDGQAVRVNYPNGGESFRVGDTVVLSWSTKAPCGAYDAIPELSVDGGLTFHPIVPRTIRSDSTGNAHYGWVVPRTIESVRTISSQCVFRVFDAYGTGQYDHSDSVFSIRR